MLSQATTVANSADRREARLPARQGRLLSPADDAPDSDERRFGGWVVSARRVTMAGMEVTAEDVKAIPVRNMHVPLREFVAVWATAERYCDEHPEDWAGAGVLAACRWLANATVRTTNGPWRKAPSPVTRRQVGAYEELVDAECIAAEVMLIRRPPHVWVRTRPGWVEAISATLNWAWRRTTLAPFDVSRVLAG